MPATWLGMIPFAGHSESGERGTHNEREEEQDDEDWNATEPLARVQGQRGQAGDGQGYDHC